MLDNTRSGDTDIDYTVPLCDAVKSTCHEGVVVRRIAEDDELRTSQ